ncbi:hypothetical protein HPB51_023308 [Rhipicephalus microplus]|uniref:HECT-type E3 ubiquitin transferase n=1 Tax=Rhipicephalus microplus TaxID=6941 RepID=A0A9J6ECV2_RHIMP|nr:hypothetical protein HPB51_023308 [Rhipicephalus microplus]
MEGYTTSGGLMLLPRWYTRALRLKVRSCSSNEYRVGTLAALASSVAAVSAAAAAAASSRAPLLPTTPVVPIAPAAQTSAPAASSPAASEKAAPEQPTEAVAMEDDSPHIENVVLEQHLKLAVVGRPRRCDFPIATAVRGCPSAMQVVLRLLLEGAQSLGATVETSIAALLAELRTLNARLASERLALEENERDDAYAAGRAATVSSPQPALASSVAAVSAAAAAAASSRSPLLPTTPVVPIAPAAQTSAPAASAPAASEKAAPSKPTEAVAMEDDSPHIENVVLEQHLKLAVETLTSKACSEEGLEDATSLLLRLSRGCPSARQVVLRLLLEGAQSLGATVETSIAALLAELRTLNARLASERLALEENERDDAYAAGRAATVSSPQPGTSGVRSTPGTIQDRFTHSTVVITAPGGPVAGPGAPPSNRLPKGGRELQLPSMGALTSKMSSQAFFLRVLKVVIQLREAAQGSLQQQLARRRRQVFSAREQLTWYAQERFSFRHFSAGMSVCVCVCVCVYAVSGACDIPPSAEPLAFSWSTESFSTSTPVAERTPHPVQPNANNHMDVDGAGVSGGPAAANGQNGSAQPLAASTPTRQGSVPGSEAGATDEPLPLSEELKLDSLWSTLSDCLLELADTQDQHAVLVLQPAVEAFFLVHASAPSAAAATGGSASVGSSRDVAPRRREYRSESRETQLAHIHQEMAPLSPLAQQQDGQAPATPGAERPADAHLHPDVQKFLGFAETHRTRRYFRHELERLDEGSRREDLAVHVRREHVFEDSFRELHRRPPEEWKNRFYIVFEGEEGQDAGGLLREWYTIISREIFNPMYALFTTSPGDRAVYDNKLLECYFTRSFYKHILGKPVKYTDMESEDYSFYQGLVFLLEHGVRALGYELTFSVEVQEFGVTEVRDLKPGGRHLPVTEETTQDFNQLDLPAYETYDKLRTMLLKAIQECTEGFGFA